MQTVLHQLETTALGVLVRESLYGFPILVAIHIMGLVMSVGMLLWFDLRLLGVALESATVSRIYRRLIPWATAGFAVMFITGAMLFVGFATQAYQNRFFRIKVAMLLLAAINATIYHLVTERGRAQWDGEARLPRAARIAGVISLIAWGTVILCGRMMAYTMY